MVADDLAPVSRQGICSHRDDIDRSVHVRRASSKCQVWWNQSNDVAKDYCPACRIYEIATRFWEVVICPIYMCLTVYEFSFILFDLCLFITIFNFILNYVLIVTFWIFTYYKIWIILIIYCFIWNYWIFFLLSGEPDYFGRNKILSGYDPSHYQVPHCIRVFFYFVWFVFIHHNFQFYFKLCTYCNILDIYLS